MNFSSIELLIDLYYFIVDRTEECLFVHLIRNDFILVKLIIVSTPTNRIIINYNWTGQMNTNNISIIEITSYLTGNWLVAILL